MRRKDWEELANKHSECRVFIEFVEEHPKQFNKWLDKKIKNMTGGY